VSVSNKTLYFIYNKNSILSGRHVSTFIRSSSGPLGKQIQKLSIFQCIWDPTMHWNIDSFWICFPKGPEDDLINVETCRPHNILLLLYIKQSVVLLTDTLYFYVITLRDGKHKKKIIRKDVWSVFFCSLCPAVSRSWVSSYMPVCSLFMSQEVATWETWKLIDG